MPKDRSNNNHNKSPTHDIVFCGMGIATCLLLRALERNGLLKGRSVAIIEPTQHHRAKTLCYWAHPDDDIALHNADILANTWTKGHVPPNAPESLGSLQYFQIRSELLYEQTLLLCKKHQIVIHHDYVDSIQRVGEHLQITTPTQTHHAIKVFDSRSTVATIEEGTLLQSFTGLFIELMEGSFSEDTITLMDFDMPQDGATQFMYVLPDDSQRALVECTRFGIEKLDDTVAREYLDHYIKRHWGAYNIVDEEHGVIPMTTKLNPSSEDAPIRGLVSIGTRGGAVKPSTGYAFTFMFEHANQICTNISKDTRIEPNVRLEFYDRLLIDILRTRPELGKVIFLQLFEQQPMHKVFKFLSEQTSIWEEASIFMRLSWPPFLSAAKRDITERLLLRSEFLLFLSTVIITLMYALFPQITYIFAGLILGIGMFLVGIPHGALDHRTIGENGVPQWSIGFHAGYWSVILAMGILWYVSPITALGLFILTSAWHFGQTDFQHWRIHTPYNLGSLLWGLSVLTILIGSHRVESAQVFQSLSVPLFLLEYIAQPSVVVTALGISILFALFKRSMSWVASICTLSFTVLLPLPIAFGLYFVGQHSIQAWSHLTKRLKATDTPIWKEAVPFTVGALLLLIGFVWNPLTVDIQPELFIIVGSCITLPHILCMDTFYRRRKQI